MSQLSDYFSDSELQCRATNIVELDINFERELLLYRETLGFPLIVNSCCRSFAHNKKIGGSETSYHIYEDVGDGRQGTLAIDLAVKNDKQRTEMVAVALNLGWSVGVYKSFIHIDRRVDIGKKQVCFWGKY